MEITSTQLKTLREQTGISVMQCKKALEEAGGDMDKAIIILKKKRNEIAEKKSDRELGAGTVGAYIHNTHEVAAMILLSCETDFVSKNEEFIALARDIAMQVAATNPTYISKTDIDDISVTKAKEVFLAEIQDKPKEMHEKILTGKMDAYFKEQILMEQDFIKNPDLTIGEMVTGAVQKFGENILVARITRLSVK